MFGILQVWIFVFLASPDLQMVDCGGETRGETRGRLLRGFEDGLG